MHDDVTFTVTLSAERTAELAPVLQNVNASDVEHLMLAQLDDTVTFPDPDPIIGPDRPARTYEYGDGEIYLEREGFSYSSGSDSAKLYIAYTHYSSGSTVYVSVDGESASFNLTQIAGSQWAELVKKLIIAAWVFRHNEHAAKIVRQKQQKQLGSERLLNARISL